MENGKVLFGVAALLAIKQFYAIAVLGEQLSNLKDIFLNAAKKACGFTDKQNCAECIQNGLCGFVVLKDAVLKYYLLI